MGNIFSCCMPPPPNLPKAYEESFRPPTPFENVEYSFNGRRWSPYYEDDEVPDFIR